MTEISKNSGFETKAIHAGQKPDPTNGAIMTLFMQRQRTFSRALVFIKDTNIQEVIIQLEKH